MLVGLNVDKSNHGLIEYGENGAFTDEERTNLFFKSIENSLNTEDFDNKEFYNQVKFFIKLIVEDRLIIRKTYEPNHAKLYLFKLEEGQVARRNLFITGSSNLTKAGLTTQNEFNVEISDYGFEEAEEYFDNLWETAVKINEYEDIKKKLIQVIENKTLIKEITPFEAYTLVLKAYLDTFEQRKISGSLIDIFEKNGYTTYTYQLDAVKQALAIIEKHSGVIIADVVGLGKSVIASALARQLKKRGIVICPPGIIGDRNKKSGWRKYTEEFGLYDWEIRSLGDLENTLEFVKAHDDIEVVIVDEAHRFRNQDTKNYELLKNICRNKIVILLTATPFNNRPADVLSLIKLFITPKKSSITLSNDVVEQFRNFKGIFNRLGYIKKYHNSMDIKKARKALNYYKSLFGESVINLQNVKHRTHYLAKQIRNIIEPITIRRNRLDLQKNPFYKKEVENLSKVADPIEWFFELTEEQSKFYDTIINDYFGNPDNGGRFKGAIYRPFEYENGKLEIDDILEKLDQEKNREFIQQRNLFDFMRRLLVKRFESSFGSFEQSIKNFKKIYSDVLAFITKTGKGDPLNGEYILDRALLEKIYDIDIDEIEKYLVEYEEQINRGEYPKKHKRYKIKDFKYKKQFIDDIKSDIRMFDEILVELGKLNLVANDPKTFCLLNNIEKEFSKPVKTNEPKRKIVIFSEYIDTVKYLAPKLRVNFNDRVLVVAGDLSAPKIEQIYKNFDASYPEQDDDFDILLCTDKISEGFNLNRAGMIINYDIPWNPVRVIQRLGRINRISKKVFNELYILNFFPTEQGSELVKSREIAQNKMFLIHNALGEDSKIFNIDEEPSPAGLYNRLIQNPENLEKESFYTKILNKFSKIKKDYPDLVEKLKDYPPRIKVAKMYNKDNLMVFFKKGRLYIVEAYWQDNRIKINNTSLEDILEDIECTPDENAIPLSETFWKAYEAIKDFRDSIKIPSSEQSVERKALNVLDFLIRENHQVELLTYKPFLNTLREDILDYGTLSDYTLRRIANLKVNNLEETIKELDALKRELGEDYLEKEKARLKDLKREIIIAIENRNFNEQGVPDVS